MTNALKQQVLDYLASHNTATWRPATATFPGLRRFLRQRRSSSMFSSPESRHCQNLAANARVAVTIQEDYKDWRLIKGFNSKAKSRLGDSVIDKAKAIAIYALKYPAVIKLFTDPANGVYHRAFLKVKFYCVVPGGCFYRQ
jgi:uncharacterized protein YhbP (UPF0306 family)